MPRFARRLKVQCSKCGQFNASGAFCTSCGNSLQGQEASPELTTPVQSSSKKVIVLVGGGVGFLILALVAFLILRPSPAVPYLKSACSILQSVDLEKQSSDELSDIASRAGDQIDSALSADSELAAPFSDVASDLEYASEKLSEGTRYLALYLASNSFLSSLYLRSANNAIDEHKLALSSVQSEISRLCSDY
jgi:hypothetical protein